MVKKNAVTITGFCVLPVLLLAAVHGGVSAAPGPSQPVTPVPQSRVATPPSFNTPAGGGTIDTPPGSPRRPGTTPMPAPAVTNNYAGLTGNSFGSAR